MRETIIDTVKVWVVNVTVLGAVTFADVESTIKCASWLAALGYTLWKWRSEAKAKKG
jgi:hypothetical protein